jgi:hypothetical protein
MGVRTLFVLCATLVVGALIISRALQKPHAQAEMRDICQGWIRNRTRSMSPTRRGLLSLARSGGALELPTSRDKAATSTASSGARSELRNHVCYFVKIISPLLVLRVESRERGFGYYLAHKERFVRLQSHTRWKHCNCLAQGGP